MLSPQEIDKLLALARLELPAEQKESLRHDVDAILAYVDQVKEAAAKAPAPEKRLVRNVLRPDERTAVTGEYTEALLAAAPEAQDGYVKVKKIL